MYSDTALIGTNLSCQNKFGTGVAGFYVKMPILKPIYHNVMQHASFYILHGVLIVFFMPIYTCPFVDMHICLSY